MNEKNLIPNEQRTPEERRRNATKAGIASGQARRQKRETRQILQNLLSVKAKDFKVFQKLASQMGLQDTVDIHELFTAICIMNSMKKGDLRDLEVLMRLTGEQQESLVEVEDLTPIAEMLNSMGEDDGNGG